MRILSRLILISVFVLATLSVSAFTSRPAADVGEIASAHLIAPEVGALAAQEEEPETMDVSTLLKLLFGLVIATPGTSTLIASIINVLKQVQLPSGPMIPDGMAPKYANIASALLTVGFFVVTLFLPNFDIPAIDVTLGQYAEYVVILGPALLLLLKFLTPLMNKALRGLPGIGYSHSMKKAEQGLG